MVKQDEPWITHPPTLHIQRKGWLIGLGVFLIGISMTLLIFHLGRPVSGHETLHWRATPIDWKEAANTLSFSVKPVVVEGETYALEDCRATYLYPYAGNTIRGEFQDLMFVYQGTLREMKYATSCTFTVTAYARPKVLTPEAMRIGFSSIKVEAPQLKPEQTLFDERALEAIQKGTREMLSNLSLSITSIPLSQNERVALEQSSLPRVDAVLVPVLRFEDAEEVK